MNTKKKYRTRISENIKFLDRLGLLILVVSGLISCAFIFVIVSGYILPIDSSIIYFGEIISGKFYMYGLISVGFVFISFKILGIKKHSTITLVINEENITILKKSEKILLNNDIIMRIVLLENGIEKDKIRIITNNYVRSFFLEVESELTSDLKKIYSDKFKIKENVLQHKL
ncbi:hypothetical protein G3567_13250 [Psychroflexus sp. YR1-1]|uniref:Uncharacterized protein n=1 Tax=Psychroflexus aurantiacus TaxID=2709310 RepID=A0A6B3R3U7_9FLAO|nr:hypothetical protein [Psychroflexus aurantiacus]NEV95102.1 hypothetical protein [Psychroflexus aurantiacus]